MHNIAVKSGAPLYSGKGLETRKQWFSIIIPSISAVCFRKSFPTILIATCDLRLKQGKLRTECCLFARPLQNHCLPDATLVTLFLITIALDWEMYSTAPNPPSAVSFSAQAGQTEPTPPTVLKQKSGGASLFFTLHRKVTPAVMCQQLFF